MRVCHFSASALDGHYFKNMAQGLSAHGVEVLLGSLHGAARPGWWRSDLRRVNSFSLGASSRSRYPAAVVRLARLLRRWRVDILQTHLFDGAAVGIPAARLARVPLLIVTRHHHDQHWLLARPLHVRLDRLMAQTADRVIVPSAAVRGLMVTRERSDGSRIQVIRLGVDVDEFCPTPCGGQPVREEFGLRGSFVVGSVGRLDPGKGVSDLLTAASLLRPVVEHLRILIVGDHPNPANRQAIAEEAQRLGLAESVIFAGHRSDIAGCMQAMDVLAHPSHSEALPQALIEAMAVGLPVVACDVGGIPELVQAGRTGLLIPAHEPTALADAIATLYRDPELRRSYSAEARRVAREHFTAERMVCEHLDCYTRWLTTAGASGGSRALADHTEQTCVHGAETFPACKT
ncbi:MAG: glycosyltransferase [Solirubrobacteraceae bacterium]